MPEGFNGNWHLRGTQISLNEGINKILTTHILYQFLFLLPLPFSSFFLLLDLKDILSMK